MPGAPWRRTIAGWSLVAAPAALLGAELVALAGFLIAGNDEEPGTVLRAVNLMRLLWSVLLIPLALGLAHLLRFDLPRWGDAGAALLVVGAVAEAAKRVLFDRAVVAAQVTPDLTPGTLLPALDQVSLPLVGMGNLVVLGLVVIALGLRRAQLTPPWVTLLLLTGLALDAVLAFTLPEAVPVEARGVLPAALIGAGLGWIGRRVLRDDGAYWERPVRYAAPRRPRWFAAVMGVLFLFGAGLDLSSPVRFVTWLVVLLALVVHPGDTRQDAADHTSASV